MLPASPTRRFMWLVPMLPVALFLSGCSDAPTPVEPRVLAPTPHALAGPTVTVTNTDDAGAGSLRQAIIDAPAGATIVFDAGIAGGTVVLSTGQLTIDKALIIEGPVPQGMTISGGLADRVLWISENVDAVLRNVSIVNGRSTFGGGVINHGRLTLDHSLVANNEGTERGGGIYVAPNVGAVLVLVNSTVSGNLSRRAGGGIASYGSVFIRNSTIAENTGQDAGGLLGGEGVVSLRNSIIANNADSDPTAGTTANCDLRPGVEAIYAGRNLSNDNDCGSDPMVIVTNNPGLAPLANNGGPTQTHAIETGKAIDGGTQCTEATDQRYVARNQGSTCDIGAFEFNNYGTVTIALNPNASVNARTGVATVTGTIKCSASTFTKLDVQLSQTQKTTGKFTTIIQAQGSATIPACGTNPSSWSATLTPATGKFEPGSATGTAATSVVAGLFLPSTVTGPVKVFQVK